MKLQELISDSITRSATEVFSTMLDVQLRCGPISIENGAPEASDGVVSFIGLAGSWAGAGSLVCSPAMACRICAQMLLTEQTAVNDEVLDAVAELTNMIVGGVKTHLESHLGPLGLSLPTIVYGKNFRTKSVGSAEWIVAPFHWEDETLIVKMCLAPSEKPHFPSHGSSQTCAMEV
ncbi:MAG: chemotaxis protein CheX [Bryobacteraceae bacterium]|jgi:chemotaxis protein CheX